MRQLWVVVVVGAVAGWSCGGALPETDGGTGGGSATGGGASTGGGANTGGGDASGGGANTGGGASTGGGANTGGGAALDCNPGEMRACCTSGMQFCGTAGTWGACSLSGQPEVCNGRDDDCDGMIDEDIVFTAAELTDAGAALDGGCAVGVGTCARSGALTCRASAPTCDATPGAASTETCNGLDDDCDGMIDDGVQIACSPDGDNDTWATDTTTTLLCPDVTRSAFGNCPAGFVAPSVSRGLDCAPTDTAAWRTADVRPDGDNDTYCLASTSQACVGTTAGQGRRFATDCPATVDCDDTNATAFLSLQVRTDADGDGACIGTTLTRCGGSTPAAGFRLAGACAAQDDCDDANAARFTLLSVRADADADGSCTGSTLMQCSGATASAGYRLASGCNAENDCDDASAARFRLLNLQRDADSDAHCTSSTSAVCVGTAGTATGFLAASSCLDQTDCNDSSSTVWRMANLGRDQDNDGYCASGALVSTCIGTNAPSGYQLTCQSTPDCKDDNAYANVACTRTLLTNQQSKYCGSQPVSETFRFTYGCGQGFGPTSATPVRQYSTCVDGSCTQVPSFNFSANGTYEDVAFNCEGFAVGHDDWKLSITCTAL